MIWDEMQRTEINGAELEIYDRGSGEPVVFIHGSMGDECAAVLNEPALAGSFRLIHYHRRGWRNSEHSGTPISAEQHAADCRAVMQRLGVDQAHIAGQSFGGLVLLQMALDVPDAVHSLALLEPVLPSILYDAPALDEAMTEAITLYEEGKKADTIDRFAREVCGDGYREDFDRTLPEGYFDRWVADVDALFEDAAAEESWTFTREEAARITRPVLNMRGARTRPYFREIHETVQEWLPHAENAVLSDAGHAMLQMNPQGAAERLADFFSRHPLHSGG